MTIGGHQISLSRQFAIIVGIGTFLFAAVDALNGFAGFLAIQPFATKSYVKEIVENQYRETVAANTDIQTRLVNLQMMSLEINISLIDGQLIARSGEQVELSLHLKEFPNDQLLKRRSAELDGLIEGLKARRNLLQCYYDNLRGFKRDCR